MSSSFLAETILTEILVIQNYLRLTLVKKTLAITCQERDSNNFSKILSFGGTETPNKVIVVYSNDRNVYPALPQESFAHCSLKVDNFVYCIGDRGTIPLTIKV